MKLAALVLLLFPPVVLSFLLSPAMRPHRPRRRTCKRTGSQEAYCEWGSPRHIAGLWTISMDGEWMQAIEANVWLEAGGSFNDVEGQLWGMSGSKGLWSMGSYLEENTFVLRTTGNPSLSLRGSLPPASRDRDDDIVEDGNGGVRMITGHVEEGSELDSEFVGRFSMVQKVCAHAEEPLLLPPEERPHRKFRPFMPLFHKASLAGSWTLAGSVDEAPMLFKLSLNRDGTFRSTNVDDDGGGGDDDDDLQQQQQQQQQQQRQQQQQAEIPLGGGEGRRLLAGKWGVFSDDVLHPDEADRRRKEQLGSHLWLWVRRKDCRGFSMNADLRMHGRIAPLVTAAEDAKTKTAKEAEEAGRGATGRRKSSSCSSSDLVEQEAVERGGGERDDDAGESVQDADAEDDDEHDGNNSEDGNPARVTSIEDELSAVLAGSGGGGGGGAVPVMNQKVFVQGFILWGESSDMEYSSLVGDFSLTPHSAL